MTKRLTLPGALVLPSHPFFSAPPFLLLSLEGNNITPTMSCRLLRQISLVLMCSSTCGLVVLGSSTVATATGSSAVAASATTFAAAPATSSFSSTRSSLPSSSFLGLGRMLPLRTLMPPRPRPRTGVVVAREICKLDTADDYHALLEQAEAENRVVVIKFYASWCRACKAMAPKFAKMADEWPDIEFVSALPFSAC